jgi:hypothetical protein
MASAATSNHTDCPHEKLDEYLAMSKPEQKANIQQCSSAFKRQKKHIMKRFLGQFACYVPRQSNGNDKRQEEGATKEKRSLRTTRSV